MEMPKCPKCGNELQWKRFAENDLSNIVCRGCGQRFLFTLDKCHECAKCGRVTPSEVCDCVAT